jgi:hypothetical protein
VRLDRPLDSYISPTLGPHGFLSKETSHIALTAMLRAVGRLNNLRVVPGAQGQLKKIPQAGGYSAYLREDYGSYSVFPTSECSHLLLTQSNLANASLQRSVFSTMPKLATAAPFAALSCSWCINGDNTIKHVEIPPILMLLI